MTTPPDTPADWETARRCANWNDGHPEPTQFAAILAALDAVRREERERLLAEFEETGVCDDWVLDALRTEPNS